MAQFLFSKRYFYLQELNKCIVLKVVAVIPSWFKIILNIVLYTLILQTFIQKSNFKISNIFNPLYSAEQDYILLALYKHRTKRTPTAFRSLQSKFRKREVFTSSTDVRFSVQALKKIMFMWWHCMYTVYIWFWLLIPTL